jgi:hypothetical protein
MKRHFVDLRPEIFRAFSCASWAYSIDAAVYCFQTAFCLEAVQAHLLEQPRHVGKKCKAASFSAPGA